MITTQQGLILIKQELTKYDPTKNEPLFQSTAARDINIIASGSTNGGWDETTSFNRIAFDSAADGGMGNIAGRTTVIPEVTFKQELVNVPVAEYTNSFITSYKEIQQSSHIDLGVRIQDGLQSAIFAVYRAHMERIHYFGDPNKRGMAGLLNHEDGTVATSSIDFATATPQAMIDEVNRWINTVWAQCLYMPDYMPNTILVPPAMFTAMNGRIVSEAGNRSVLNFLRENNVVAESGGTLEIKARRQCIGTGANGADRIAVYTKDPKFIRANMLLPLTARPTFFDGRNYETIFDARVGGVELRYPQTLLYVDHSIA